jgi:hypothetical protein
MLLHWDTVLHCVWFYLDSSEDSPSILPVTKNNGIVTWIYSIGKGKERKVLEKKTQGRSFGPLFNYKECKRSINCEVFDYPERLKTSSMWDGVSGNYLGSQTFYLMGAMFDLEARGWHSSSWGSPDVLALWRYLPQGLWGPRLEYEAVHVSGVYLYRGGCVAKELWEKAERR